MRPHVLLARAVEHPAREGDEDDEHEPGATGDRPWGPGNNPKTAVRAWLPRHPEFEVDRAMEHKLLVTVAPEGFLRRVA